MRPRFESNVSDSCVVPESNVKVCCSVLPTTTAAPGHRDRARGIFAFEFCCCDVIDYWMTSIVAEYRRAVPQLCNMGSPGVQGKSCPFRTRWVKAWEGMLLERF